MDRLREHCEELVRVTVCAGCLAAKLEATGQVDADCSRGAFKFDTAAVTEIC